MPRMFASAIVRGVPETMSAGIITADLGIPDTEKAREQARSYVAAGYEAAKRGITESGHEVTELEISEFRKLDGGSSCLSLRLPELTL